MVRASRHYLNLSPVITCQPMVSSGVIRIFALVDIIRFDAKKTYFLVNWTIFPAFARRITAWFVRVGVYDASVSWCYRKGGYAQDYRSLWIDRAWTGNSMRLLLILSFIQSQRSRIIVNGWLIVFSLQVCPMKQLSDGQRCRVSFAWLAWQQPHLLLLDGEILFRYPKQQNKSDQF